MESIFFAIYFKLNKNEKDEDKRYITLPTTCSKNAFLTLGTWGLDPRNPAHRTRAIARSCTRGERDTWPAHDHLVIVGVES